MPFTGVDAAQQEKLKRELQADDRPQALERFAAAALGRLMDVPVAVARAGFQHGGDAGPAGQGGRRFRIESKKYSDTTRLSDRELLGEIDHALARDEALEAWILVATKAVPEQLLQDLNRKGETIGVPILVVDWADHDIAPLAALCAYAPDLVEAEFSNAAGALARSLTSVAQGGIELLRRSLSAWNPGYEILRRLSHAKLDQIWNSPRASNAELNQDAAGGAQPKKVRRTAVLALLDAWWSGSARNDAPAAVLGFEGVGKTWAALDWLTENKANQPIILFVPSQAAARITDASETGLKRFLGERLYEIAGVRSVEHFTRRLEYMLKRPAAEGPVMTVVFDGLNQEPSLPWPKIMKVLQGDSFAGRIRVIAITRRHHFQERLGGLRGLVVSAAPIAVDTYDDDELRRMLEFEGLNRADLHPDLAELARTPRLFKLVVRLRERLSDAGPVTLHRLLWEYGRDTFAERAGTSFSEQEWREWLKAIAERHLAGIRNYSLRTLAETAQRPDLSEREVYARLSDIIDGQFAKPAAGGAMQLVPTVVIHALGAALLAQLDAIQPPEGEAIEHEMTRWLDPITGLDQRAEILRAAVSIVIERGGSPGEAADALVTAWLQTQNVPDAHRRELATLAPEIPDALLTAVQRSDTSAHGSARLWAVNALRAIKRNAGPPLDAVVKRTSSWLGVVSRDVDHRLEGDKAHEKHRSERLTTRIGKDESGPMTVLGTQLQLVDYDHGELHSIVPSILEGFPVASLMPVFETVAVASAVGDGSSAWNGLKWLCHLNETDPVEAAKALRSLSEDLRTRKPEPGVHPDLAARAGALLLWLSGIEADEEQAVAFDPGIDRWLTYEKDYLAKPSRSIFALERRHAGLALADKDVAIAVRIQRTQEFWLDPQFEPPDGFTEELRAFAASFDVDALNAQGSHTREDHVFDGLLPALARCAPELLADLIRRKTLGYAKRPASARYWTAVSASKNWLVAGDAESDAAHALRTGAKEADTSNEAAAAGYLLLTELKGLPAPVQYERMIAAGLKFIWTDFREVLKPLLPEEADALIARYGSGPEDKRHDLLVLLSVQHCLFTDDAWSWLLAQAENVLHRERGVVFRTLARCDAARFGRDLAQMGWTWDGKADLWVNHYGTGALIEATSAMPFDQLLPRLAPWRVLEAARKRGADAVETRLAAETFGHVLAAGAIEEPDPGSDISVQRPEDRSSPLIFSAEPRPRAEDRDDPMARFKHAMDGDARLEEHRRAGATAAARIDAARSAGASLYLTDMNPEDFAPVLRHAPEIVKRWLEGSDELSDDFRRRVRLAEASFLSLCEALLEHDPKRGVGLWRGLRSVMATRYVGSAGVDEMLHAVFRAPESPEVSALRQELLDPKVSGTDEALLDLAIAASFNGNSAWLSSATSADEASPLSWRQKRCLVMGGLTTGNSLPVDGAWPDGQRTTDHADLRRRSGRFRWSEACARHWWKTYLAAPDTTRAFAAWQLFLNSADRRAWIWMRRDADEQNDRGSLLESKLAHAQLNRSTLKKAMEKRSEKLQGKFLRRDIVESLGPWVKRQET
jgi:hypothetical protein